MPTRTSETTSTGCAAGRRNCSPSSTGSGSRGSFSFCLDEPDREPAFRAANDRTLAYAAENPDRIIPFVRLDLAEGPIEEATRCLDLGARGIKLHPRAQKFSVGDERLDAVFALAVEREVPILIHGGRGLPPIGDHLAALVERYAGVRLIIAHAGIADLGGLAGHFAQVPGVFFDTSVWGIIDLVDLMRQVAPEQILFATDYPYGRLPNSLLLALRAARLSHFDETTFAACSARRRRESRTVRRSRHCHRRRGRRRSRTRCRWRASTPTSRWRRRCSGCASPTSRAGSAWR